MKIFQKNNIVNFSCCLPSKHIKNVKIVCNDKELFDFLNLKNDIDFDRITPYEFVEWLINSERYYDGMLDTIFTKLKYNDKFLSTSYDIINQIEVSSLIKPTLMDLEQYKEINEQDLITILKYEYKYLNDKQKNLIIRICNRYLNKNNDFTINGNFLIKIGYKPGPIFKEILSDVRSQFTVFNEEQISSYILGKYPIERHSKLLH